MFVTSSLHFLYTFKWPSLIDKHNWLSYSYRIFGSSSSAVSKEKEVPEAAGIVPRFCYDLFREIEAKKTTGNCSFQIQISKFFLTSRCCIDNLYLHFLIDLRQVILKSTRKRSKTCFWIHWKQHHVLMQVCVFENILKM